jgi:hypothetical protein
MSEVVVGLPRTEKRGLSLAQLLGVVAVWGVAIAWPQWMAGEEPPSYDPYRMPLLEAVIFTIPLGVPLMILVMAGRPILPWLGLGAFVGYALVIPLLEVNVFESRLLHTSAAIVFGGLGAGAMGAGRICYLHLVDRARWRAVAWGALAIVCGGSVAALVVVLMVI